MPSEIRLLRYFLCGLTVDCLNTQLCQFALEGFCTFDLRYLNRHVLLFEKAFDDGLRSSQWQMTFRQYLCGGYGLSKTRLRPEQVRDG